MSRVSPAAAVAVMTLLAGEPAAAGDARAMLDYFEQKGARVTRMGEEHGLTAIVVETANRDKAQVFYLTPDGKAAILGEMYDIDGSSVTSGQIERLMRRLARGGAADDTATKAVPPPPPPPAPPVAVPAAADREFGDVSTPAALRAALETVEWRAAGRGGRQVVYMFADPRCPYCKRTWQTLAPHVRSGALELRIVPVAVLSPQSVPPALALLAQRGDIAAQMEDMAAAKPVAEDEGLVDALKLNMRLMEAADITAVPYLLWTDRSGAIRNMPGAPRDARQVLEGGG